MPLTLATLPVQSPWDFARLGPYKVLGTIAEGGMGIVLRGQDVRSGALVALKTVRSQQRYPAAALRREISVLGKLSHPGIVRLVSDGMCGDAPWMAMEMLAGETLSTQISALWQRRAPLPTAAAGWLSEGLFIVARLCDALAYLHGRGLVHRDVKPANVFLRDDGGVTLLDFGLVCAARGASPDLRTSEVCVGTLEYAAPEQLRGEPVDTRADIYSVGSLLYELITGRTLADADACDTIGLVHPVAPSELVAGVPRALETLLRAMLARRREDRPSPAGEIADALDQIAGRMAAAA
ncbi:MAG TPA: serine/threonine-protein kinase [Polyangia bacterium]|nr:serine/threonine-protein kinase [Polyangia bacterium]